ncbi:MULTISPECIES: hypothetical protein [Streptomyces]|uniref:hypothetical protein n=1 Tax=Streptomyces TaxID=1883 RepID=UPI000E6A2A55|nr:MULTISPECIES: hypothetical protein [Streptomyces]MDX3065810.1 hypothetical protein [Streptomyces sp. ND04-05B]MDX3519684.1 hypothetical protein [Streptomyces scabiei]
MTTTPTAADRVAAIRAEYAAMGEPLDDLSDLEVLNRAYDAVQREQITTRDRYMGLLTSLRRHDDSARRTVAAELAGRADLVVAQALERRARAMVAVLAAVEVLPERPGRDRVALLKQIAQRTRHTISLLADHPREMQWRPDANRSLVHNARSVLGVLRERDGVPASEVIRLIDEALAPDGNLRDLFDVADRHPRQPGQGEDPAFAGPHWFDRKSFYAYEPTGRQARVVAFRLGEDWHLDVCTNDGRLLAYGTVPEGEVAHLAPELVERAAAWATSSGYAWQRFTATAEDVRSR